MKAKLVVVGGEAKAAEIDLKLPTVIGRGREASLTLPHPLVSRQHCELFEASGKLIARDLGSLNGTFINNERIDGEAELSPGELLTIGTVTFRAVYEIDPHAMPPEDIDPAATVQVNNGPKSFAEATQPAEHTADSSDLTEPAHSSEGVDDNLDDEDFSEFDNLEFDDSPPPEAAEAVSVGELPGEPDPDYEDASHGDAVGKAAHEAMQPLADESTEQPAAMATPPTVPQSLPTPGQALPLPQSPGTSPAASPQAVTPPTPTPQAIPFTPPEAAHDEGEDADDDALSDFLRGLQ